MKNSRFRHIFNHAGLVVFTALLFGAIGTYTLLQTRAATGDTLYGNQTITAGNQMTSQNGGIKLKMQTDGNLVLRNWQDTIIWSTNTAGSGGTVFVLQAADGNMVIYTSATNGTAVWSANTFDKGGTKLIVQNDGNLVLYTSTGTPVWATGTNGKQGTPPAPAPAPAPTPAPTPTPTPKPTPTTPKTTTPKATTPKTTTPATPTTTTVSNAADATATAGSATVTLSVPAGNASTVYVRYGTDANNLNRSSDIQTISGATATIKLDKLNGKTTYTYQIVRAQDNQTATSANATFTTKGYAIALKFTDASGKPVEGISAQLGSAKPVKSNDNGTVTFKNLGTGSYSPIFTYNGQSYSENFSTSTDGTESDDGTVVLGKTIDLSKLHKSSSNAVTNTQPESGSSKVALLIFVLLLAAVGSGIWWAVRRKRRLLAEAYGYGPTDYVPPVIVDNPLPAPSANPEPRAVVEAVSRHGKTKKHHEPTMPAPAHMGESLRDMVIQSMAEDAAKHPNDRPKPPIVPGG